MAETQESILHHNFIQQIPKSISDKVSVAQDGQCDGKFQGGGKFQGQQGNGYDPSKGKPEIIADNDKNHASWHVKQGEDFTKVFYKNQKLYPKTQEGKAICMKFFIHGFYNKSCSRVHKLSPEDEKNFVHFIFSCHKGAV
jgi:hypothetical protein